MSALAARLFPTPIGTLRLEATDSALIGVHFPSEARSPAPEARLVAAHPVLEQAARELEEYFRGQRRTFSIPLAATATAFQRDVWAALAAIPFGQCRSYAEIAAAIGRPRAVRAVGAANGANPLSILVPCHRVIGADGQLTGYGGGVRAKAWLLAHERSVSASCS
jgi:methylated-DNA-[protein]-cysteine S-methyltransferase